MILEDRWGKKRLFKSKSLDIARKEKARIDSHIRIEKDLEVKVGR